MLCLPAWHRKLLGPCRAVRWWTAPDARSRELGRRADHRPVTGADVDKRDLFTLGQLGRLAVLDPLLRLGRGELRADQRYRDIIAALVGEPDHCARGQRASVRSGLHRCRGHVGSAGARRACRRLTGLRPGRCLYRGSRCDAASGWSGRRCTSDRLDRSGHRGHAPLPASSTTFKGASAPCPPGAAVLQPDRRLRCLRSPSGAGDPGPQRQQSYGRVVVWLTSPTRAQACPASLAK